MNIAKVTTYSGVEITMQMAKVDNKYWGRLSAVYLGDSSKDSEIEKLALEEVKEINQRAKKWAYWLPSAVFENLSTNINKLLMTTK
jgi:phosphopantetheine adenylyltransferase